MRVTFFTPEGVDLVYHFPDHCIPKILHGGVCKITETVEYKIPTMNEAKAGEESIGTKEENVLAVFCGSYVIETGDDAVEINE